MLDFTRNAELGLEPVRQRQSIWMTRIIRTAGSLIGKLATDKVGQRIYELLERVQTRTELCCVPIAGSARDAFRTV